MDDKIKGYNDLVRTDNFVFQSTDKRSYKHSLARLEHLEKRGGNLDRITKLEDDMQQIKEMLQQILGEK